MEEAEYQSEVWPSLVIHQKAFSIGVMSHRLPASSFKRQQRVTSVRLRLERRRVERITLNWLTRLWILSTFVPEVRWSLSDLSLSNQILVPCPHAALRRDGEADKSSSCEDVLAALCFFNHVKCFFPGTADGPAKRSFGQQHSQWKTSACEMTKFYGSKERTRARPILIHWKKNLGFCQMLG